MAETNYCRLPGRGLRRQGRIAVTRNSCRLYLGNDHLLCVDSTGYTETYRRFYYADIQAIQIAKTERGKGWNWFLGIFTVVAALIALGLSGAGAIALWSTSGALLLFLLINVARGPTCAAQLQTAVYVEQLPSLNRLRVANKALAQLRPCIEQAQGIVTPEQLTAYATNPDGTVVDPRTSSARSASAGNPSRAAESSYRGSIHRILFTFLLFDAAETVAELFVRHVSLSLGSALLTMVLMVLGVAALVRQKGSKLSPLAKGLTRATMTYLGVFFILGNVLHTTLSLKDPSLANDQWRALQAISQISPFESPWYLALLLTALVMSLSLGSLGLVALRSKPASPVTAATPPEAAQPAAQSDPTLP
jgi:hypothetical protein